MPSNITEKVSLRVSDGTMMDVSTARPNDVNKHPGIMVFQEAFGVNHHIRNILDRFATEGYIAAAPELYHRTQPGFEGSYTDFEGTRKHIQAVTVEGLTADIKTTNEWLYGNNYFEEDKVVSIGFCLGGRVSFLANTVLNLKAAASFYGGSISETLLDKVNDLSAPQLMFWGGLDKHITSDKINKITEELSRQNKNFTNVVFSRAEHGFFCDERASYNPDSARQAWLLVKEYFKTYLSK